MGKPESKKPLVRPRSGWVDNIKVDLEELGCSTWTGFIRKKKGTGDGLL
jgi:hypothetical protein